MDNYVPVGIDLGTTYSCIYVFKEGKYMVCPNNNGERITPSIVVIKDDETIVGEDTLPYLISYAENSIYGIKRIIGREFIDKEVQDDIKSWPFKVIKEKGGSRPKIIVIKNNKNEEFFPEEISSFVLKKLVNQAEKLLEVPIKKVVITVPAYFNDSQRNSTKQAGQIAGLEVLRVINEPTAAALAYGLDDESLNINQTRNFEEQFILENKGLKNDYKVTSSLEKDKYHKRIIVFDLGGGTFDVSLLDLIKNKDDESSIINVIGTDGDNHLGGEDFDNVLMDYAIEEFRKITDYNISEKEIRKNSKSMKRLKIRCEQTKRILSKEENIKENNSIEIVINNLCNNIDLCCSIKSLEFIEKCQKLYERLLKPIDRVLKDANLKDVDINNIILIGGSTRMPKIKEIISNKFQNANINDTINPEEAVAYGACVQANKILNKTEKILLQDITPFTLGVAVAPITFNKTISNGKLLMDPIIKKNTKIPVINAKNYKTCFDEQNSIKIKILQGEDKYAENNREIKSFLLNGIEKRKKGDVKCVVTFNLDINGILTANAKENSRGIEENVSVLAINNGSLREEELGKIKEVNQSFSIDEKEVSQEKLELVDNLNDCLEEYKNTNDLNVKYKILDEAIKILEVQIDGIENSLKNDSDDNQEKIENYFKKVCEYLCCYALMEKCNKLFDLNKRNELIDNVKIYIDKFIIYDSVHRIETFLSFFGKSKKDIKDEIVIYAIDKFYKKGIQKIRERKEGDQLAKVKSKINFEACLKIQKLNLPEYSNKLIIRQCQEYLILFNYSAVKLIEYYNKTYKLFEYEEVFKDFSLEKNNESIIVYNLIILDDFYEALKEIHINKKICNKHTDEIEAWILANIVKINYICLKKNNYEYFLELIKKSFFKIIGESLIKKYNWYKEISDIKNNIENKIENEKKIETSEIKKLKENYANQLQELESVFNNDNSYENYINFILKKYPYNNFKDDIKKNIIHLDLYNEFLIDYLINKYNPRNLRENTKNDKIFKIYASLIYSHLNIINIKLLNI